MACCLMAPSHYLNLCWFFICEVLCHSPDNNFTVSAQATILYNQFANDTFEFNAHLPGANELTLWFMCSVHFQPVSVILTNRPIHVNFGARASPTKFSGKMCSDQRASGCHKTTSGVNARWVGFKKRRIDWYWCLYLLTLKGRGPSYLGLTRSIP